MVIAYWLDAKIYTIDAKVWICVTLIVFITSS